ncbi:MAG: DUF87 domain-containing protein [Desulforudis sp.]|nr:MAG: DUF87 domain-containing protein [Desulforudis sp.]
MRLLSRKKSRKKLPGKDQPSIFKGAAGYRDLLAPSLVKEVKKDDYWVEIGATVEPVRYFRSFYAAMTGGTTYAGMLTPLYLADFGEADCDIALHVAPADPVRTLWDLEQKIAQLEAEFAEEKNSARRQVILGQVQELRDKHSAIRMEAEKPFFVSIQALVSSTDFESFRRFGSLLVKRFAGKGIHLRAADTRQLEALMEMSPLDRKAIKDVFRDMESSNIADLLPLGIGGIRHRDGVILGVSLQDEVILYDAWEPSMGNYNMVIFGRSGFGKSFLIKLLIARSVPLGIVTAIIDPEGEFENLVRGLGCPYIRLSAKSRDRINIFDVDVEEGDDGNARVDLDGAVQAVQAVVFKMIRAYDQSVLTGHAKVLIQDRIQQLYAARGITEDPASLREDAWDGGVLHVGGRKKRMPTLSDLHDLMEREPVLEKAAQLLKPFTRKGLPSQAIFDCESTVEIMHVPAFAICVADLDDEIMKPLGMFVATKWVWEVFGRDRKTRKRIITDEAQLMMSEPETADWEENAFRRARKRNISMCAASQGFEVFLRVPQGLGVLKNSSTKIMMRQEALDIAAVREKFSLSEGEAMFLLSAKKGWGIVKADTDAAIFYGKVTDEEYRWFTTDPNEILDSEVRS